MYHFFLLFLPDCGGFRFSFLFLFYTVFCRRANSAIINICAGKKSVRSLNHPGKSFLFSAFSGFFFVLNCNNFMSFCPRDVVSPARLPSFFNLKKSTNKAVSTEKRRGKSRRLSSNGKSCWILLLSVDEINVKKY